MAQTNQGTSNDTRTIVTILLLIFLFPIGFILMWAWARWPSWVKIVVSLPIVLVIVAILSTGALVARRPQVPTNYQNTYPSVTSTP